MRRWWRWWLLLSTNSSEFYDSSLYSLMVTTCSCCLLLLQLKVSESFILPTTSNNINIKTRNAAPVVVIHHNSKYYYHVSSRNYYRYYSPALDQNAGAAGGAGGITTLLLSHQQQQNTIEEEKEKEMSTTKTKQRTWEESFQLLVSYKEQHGNCNVPTEYKDDPRLGWWVMNQRKTKDRLSDECIAKLDGIGFLWANELYEEQWEVMFEKLVQYAKKNNGDCNIPGNHDNNDVNKELYIWVKDQRMRKSLLSEERRTKLDKLGLIWKDSNKVKADQKWNEQYESLKHYKRKYGHCKVPQQWEEDKSLGRWVDKQRQKYRKGELREDRQMKLEEMDFTWKARDKREHDYSKLDLNWLGKFGILLNFVEEYEHCNVPRNYKKDPSLGLWVNYQRVNQRNGSLREVRKELLDDIGFTWSFNDLKDKQWREKYKELKRFKETSGHLRVPSTSGSLTDWVYQQRVLYAAGKVSPERKALLDEIDFRWEIQIQNSSLS